MWSVASEALKVTLCFEGTAVGLVTKFVASSALDKGRGVAASDHLDTSSKHADTISHGLCRNGVVGINKGKEHGGSTWSAMVRVPGLLRISLEVRWNGDPFRGEEGVGGEFRHKLIVRNEAVVVPDWDVTQLHPGEALDWA